MMKEISNLKNKLVGTTKEVIEDESGMELLQIVILCLIAVLVGGTLLSFFDDSFKEIGGLMVNKIKSIFSL